MTLPAATEVSNVGEFLDAIWAVNKSTEADKFELTGPVNIKLMADITLNYSDNTSTKYASSPFSKGTQQVFVMPGSVIDLNGHTLMLSNMKLFFSEDGTTQAEEQRYVLCKNGTVNTRNGNGTNNAWTGTAAKYALGGCLTDMYTTSADAFKSSTITEFIIPAGATLHTVNTTGTTYDFVQNEVAPTFIVEAGAKLDLVAPLPANAIIVEEK